MTFFALSKLTPFSTHIATYMHTKTGTHYMNACAHTLMHIPRSNHLARSCTILARIMQARSHNLGRTFLYFLLILQDVDAKCPFSCISCKKIVKILHATLARKLARFLFLARDLARSLLSCKKFCKA